MEQLTAESAAKLVLEENGGQRIEVLAPIVKDKPGKHDDVLEHLLDSGFARVRVDKDICRIEEVDIDGRLKHTIDVVVDRLELKRTDAERLIGSLETALETGDGTAIVAREGSDDLIFAEQLMCPYCGIQYEKLDAKAFSYNRPSGACPVCNGLGVNMEVDEELVILDENETPIDIAIRAMGNRSWYLRRIEALGKKIGFPPHKPLKNLTKKQREIFLYGRPQIELSYKVEREERGSSYEITRTWFGLIPWLERLFDEGKTSDKQWYQRRARKISEQFMRKMTCSACDGRKLKPESLAVTIGNHSIDEVSSMTIENTLTFFEKLELTDREHKIADLVLKEIISRLRFLVAVGLEYLNLDRLSRSLSGGESQRIRLATQIGSALTGVLYCLDEPSIGLHPRDINRLIDTFYHLRSLGNTVVVIEHDRDTINAADHIVDLGPRAGVHGGRIVTEGQPSEVLTNIDSLTAQYLAGEKKIPIPNARRNGNGKKLILKGAKQHNLKDITVEFPLGKFICVTGVSGSGKSTLVYETLYKKLAREINERIVEPGVHDALDGIENVERLVLVDQSPIGRTPRSNPATYTKTFDHIRALFAQMPEAKKRGYKPGRFSFNTKAGRCSKCDGSGVIKVEMHFMSDVFITCDVCKGKRFDRETLEVTYKGKNISEVLALTVDESLDFFKDIPKIADRLTTLIEVGLGYIQLGQPATQLSGGEAQRMKIAAELWKKGTENTLYILDEPTTGLSAFDVHILLKALKKLVDSGHTVIMIEHNLEVIKTADWVIDLGPEGGDAGGSVIATGTPEDLCDVVKSYTGNHLRAALYGPNVQYGSLE
jgi:excinuclease ABC subunit A